MSEISFQPVQFMPDTPRFNHALQELVQAVSIWAMQQTWAIDLKANVSLAVSAPSPSSEAG